jgi:hypothetical protein
MAMREDAACLAPEIIIKCGDVKIRQVRHEIAHRVVGVLHDQLPNETLLCFLDDEDWKALRCEASEGRGFYSPAPDLDKWPPPPQYIEDALGKNGVVAYQNFVYLFGSTCSIPEGLAMTLAHELQHFIQHGSSKTAWAMGMIASTLLRELEMRQVSEIGVNSWCDVPIERHAWMTGKRVAEAVFGRDAVRKYIDTRIAAAGTVDVADWKFVREIDASQAFDFDAEMASFMPRLSAHRNKLEQYLNDLRRDPALADIELGLWMRGTRRST